MVVALECGEAAEATAAAQRAHRVIGREVEAHLVAGVFTERDRGVAGLLKVQVVVTSSPLSASPRSRRSRAPP